MGSNYLTELLIILFSSVVVVSLFRLFKASPILGYLLAGALIGPHAFKFITQTTLVDTLGEYGVVFLLFTLGLKMPLQRLHVLRRYVFGLGFVQVLLTSLVFFGVCYGLGFHLDAAILVGSALALSSTAVSMQVLQERGEFAQRYGRVSFAILLLQDLAVVLILIIQLRLTQTSESVGQDVLWAMGKAIAVLITIILAGRFMLRPLYHGIAKLDNAELFVAVTLLVVLIMGLLTHHFGLSMELGAFLAGLFLSETEYRHQVEADIQPFYGLLLGLFFMSVGMGLNFTFIMHHIPEIIVILISFLSLKGLILYGCCRVFLLPTVTSLRTAFLLASGGEFVFVILKPTLHYNLITLDTSQLIYAVITLSMALTPLLTSLGRYVGQQKTDKEADKLMKAASDEISDLKNHVIIAGFGRVGKMVAKILLDNMIPFVVIDNSKDVVQEAKTKGWPVFYGDARRGVVMKMLGAAKAKAVVINLNTSKSVMQATWMLVRQFPNLNISVRMRDESHKYKLEPLGINVIVPENLEPSLRLASSVLHAMGTPDVEINTIIDNFRHTYQEEGSPKTLRAT